MQSGIYETLVTEILAKKLSSLEKTFYIQRKKLDAGEAAGYLSRFLSKVIYLAIESIPDNDDKVIKQIEIANSLVTWLAEHFKTYDLSENLLETRGQLLTALFESKNAVAADLEKHVHKITPLTGLAQSELFTGSNAGLSLESELKKEIMSSNEICWLVSFIKWTGIRIFVDILKEAAMNGTRIRIITTTYMGATDQKAVDFLAGLPNSEIRISYNTEHERLHAKAYLFLRDSGFDTGYIGSSNLSRSALTNGLEWNLKVTTQEIPHIISKFKSTFETYWASNDFDVYHVGDQEHQNRLKKALQVEKQTAKTTNDIQYFFDIEPHPYQKEILQRLLVERHVHGRYRNLVVAATGTGKTIVSAFDFRDFYKQQPQAKLLFVAHREEILNQARNVFRAVLRDASFGELFVGGHTPEHYRHLFVSVQTLNSRLAEMNLTHDYYDFIIIDEVHHIAADSYRTVLTNFQPQILLGLTATPERHDGTNIQEDFCHVIAAELRLPEAINLRYLCPFQYFGIDDTVDLSQASWVRGRYLPSELTNIYTANDQRVGHILRALHDIVGDLNKIKALAFCASQEHAKFMAEKFSYKNVKAAALTSANSEERNVLRNRLIKGEINVLCVVDIFNEGIDIPEIDTVLFLRPTESLTIFLQQLGRGLRLADGKDCLTVLDFVGNCHSEYDFSGKFRALTGKSHISIEQEVHEDFPHLPLGCSIVLQKQAKEVILQNIRNAIVSQKKLVFWISNYSRHTERELSLLNFLELHPEVRLEDIYKTKVDNGGGWTRLCIKAGVTEDFLDAGMEQAMYRGIFNRLLQCSSRLYLEFVHSLLKTNNWDHNDPVQNQMALMMHYDFWQKPGKESGFRNLEESIHKLTNNRIFQNETRQVLEQVLRNLDSTETKLNSDFPCALGLHARYTRDEILAAFGENSFEKKSTSREGYVDIKSLNCELLFVTLQKTEKKFSPTTLYQDYAINESLFHWQSQNSARPDKGKGLDYIQHQKTGKKIILFVRELSSDEYNRTMGFVNLGFVDLVSHSGSQPMNITWRLQTPLPAFLWNDAGKLAVG